MSKYKGLVIQLSLLLIITVPTFFSLFKAPWFSIHDDQHIARLYLLDTALKQGYLYPRWVDTLGFGFGYPLFNFYPPLIYYVAEVFHLVGFSLITSLKLMIVIGYFIAAVGIFFLAKKYIGKAAGLVSAAFYTYFTYHAVVVYVRGALAEFFAMAILPFVFLTLHNLLIGLKLPRGVKFADISHSTIYFGLTLALLILAHPLIALPTLFFIGFFFLFYYFCHSKSAEPKGTPEVAGSSPESRLSREKWEWHPRGLRKLQSANSMIIGLLIALSLSAFFWLPSLAEKKFTLVDNTLIQDLANYKLHYIFPQQLWYSPWGYGGSAHGLADGMSFQLGKIHIGFTLLAFILYLVYRFSSNIITEKKKQEMAERTSYFVLSFICLLFSLFMSTPYSSFIWDTLSPLWYIQFPWRFHTFTALFISLCCGYFLFLLTHLYKKLDTTKTLTFLALVMSFLPVFFYQKYFYPQRYINANDKERTTYEEIAWRISRSSYDFVPKGVRTTKTALGTTVVDIKKEDLLTSPYTILNGSAEVTILKNNFMEKVFQINAASDITFQLNTYNFPGWRVYISPSDGKTSGVTGSSLEFRLSREKWETGSTEVEEELIISDPNPYKLITVSIPKGDLILRFQFEDTLVRKSGNLVSIVTVLAMLYFIFGYYRATSAK